MFQDTNFSQFLLCVLLWSSFASSRSLYDQNVPSAVNIHSATPLLAGFDTRLSRRMQDVGMDPFSRTGSPTELPQSPPIQAIRPGSSPGAEPRAEPPRAGPRVGAQAEARSGPRVGAQAEARTGPPVGSQAEPRNSFQIAPPYQPGAAAQPVATPQPIATPQSTAAPQPAEEARARTICDAFRRFGHELRADCTAEQTRLIKAGCCTLGVGLCMVGAGAGMAIQGDRRIEALGLLLTMGGCATEAIGGLIVKQGLDSHARAGAGLVPQQPANRAGAASAVNPPVKRR